MLPGIDGGAAVNSCWPLAFVIIAQVASFRHDKAVIEQTLDSNWRRFLEEFYVTNQGLIEDGDKFRILANCFLGFGDDKPLVLEFYHLADDSRRRDIIQVARHWGACIR